MPLRSATMDATRLVDQEFWHQPLDVRMRELASIRELGACLEIEVDNPITQGRETFFALTRYDEVVDASRRPEEFCSGLGATSVFDMPVEMLEFFGGFINMDNPRHARQRRIVAHAFTPNALAGLLESVETICVDLIDEFCESGEADLVEMLSRPLPLLVICDMMGIPRSEFTTVLDATNVILSGGDPEFVGDDAIASFLVAGGQLAELMGDLIEQRRKNPTDDLTSKLVHHDLPEDELTAAEITSFFVLLAVAGNDTTRNAISHGVNLLAANPEQRAIWLADLDRHTPTAVEEIVRMASPVTFMRRTATRTAVLGDREFAAGDKLVLMYGAANRDPRVFTEPERFDITRQPNPHLGFGGPGPHFCLGANLARRELAVVFRQLLERLPDIRVSGEVRPLQSQGLPLVAGIKSLPVAFTPAARSM